MGVAPVEVIFPDEVPYEERDERNGEADRAERVFARPVHEMRQGHRERPRMDLGIRNYIQPAKQAENKKG